MKRTVLIVILIGTLAAAAAVFASANRQDQDDGRLIPISVDKVPHEFIQVLEEGILSGRIYPSLTGSYYFRERFEAETNVFDRQVKLFRLFDPEVSAHVIFADVTWESADENPPEPDSSCGFVFRDNDREAHPNEPDSFMISQIAMDRKDYLWGSNRDTLVNYGRKDFPDPKPDQKTHKLAVFANGSDVSVLLDGVELRRHFDVSVVNPGQIFYMIQSGTNTGFGTRCTFENVNLFVPDFQPAPVANIPPGQQLPPIVIPPPVIVVPPEVIPTPAPTATQESNDWTPPWHQVATISIPWEELLATPTPEPDDWTPPWIETAIVDMPPFGDPINPDINFDDLIFTPTPTWPQLVGPTETLPPFIWPWHQSDWDPVERSCPDDLEGSLKWGHFDASVCNFAAYPPDKQEIVDFYCSRTDDFREACSKGNIPYDFHKFCIEWELAAKENGIPNRAEDCFKKLNTMNHAQNLYCLMYDQAHVACSWDDSYRNSNCKNVLLNRGLYDGSPDLTMQTIYDLCHACELYLDPKQCSAPWLDPPPDCYDVSSRCENNIDYMLCNNLDILKISGATDALIEEIGAYCKEYDLINPSGGTTFMMGPGGTPVPNTDNSKPVPPNLMEPTPYVYPTPMPYFPEPVIPTPYIPNDPNISDIHWDNPAPTEAPPDGHGGFIDLGEYINPGLAIPGFLFPTATPVIK